VRSAKLGQNDVRLKVEEEISVQRSEDASCESIALAIPARFVVGVLRQPVGYCRGLITCVVLKLERWMSVDEG